MTKSAIEETVAKWKDRLEQRSILDKIRAEIEQKAYPIVSSYNKIDKGITLYEVLEIIDKYKAERRDKE